MSTHTSGGTQSEQPRQRRILVEDILDGLIARVSGVLQPDAASTTTPEVTAQVQEVVQLAQRLLALNQEHAAVKAAQASSTQCGEA